MNEKKVIDKEEEHWQTMAARIDQIDEHEEWMSVRRLETSSLEELRGILNANGERDIEETYIDRKKYIETDTEKQKVFMKKSKNLET